MEARGLLARALVVVGGVGMMRNLDYSTLPEEFREAVRLYLESGCEMTGWLAAAIEGRLPAAMIGAEAGAQYRLHRLACWFYEVAPSEAWGSREKRLAWQKAGGRSLVRGVRAWRKRAREAEASKAEAR